MRALLLIDIQNDFVPGGALAVPDGHLVVPVANELQDKFDLVVATQDWHPANHGSFAANHPGRQIGEVIELDGLRQILWPVHCVENTRGAELHPDLRRDRIARVFPKGTDPLVDSYSGFFDNGYRKGTGMEEWLRAKGVDTVYIAGLATDYCVKFSALDAVRQGFATHVVADGCRAVNLAPGDDARAFDAMAAAGVHLVASAEIR